MKTKYRFDYSKSRPNRFAGSYKKGVAIVNLDSDVAEDFPASESVNASLHFLTRIARERRSEINSK